MKKWIPIIFVLIFPYVPIVLFACNVAGEWVFVGTGISFCLALAGSIAHLAFSVCQHHSGERMALTNVLVKLIHIPAYLFFFLVGVMGALSVHFWVIAVVVFLFDCAIIALSGLISLSATIRLRAENKLTTGKMIIFSVTSFLFCIDVISAIILYIKARKKDLA